MIFFSDLFCNPICWAVAYENVARIKMGDTERYLVQSFYKKSQQLITNNTEPTKQRALKM